MRSAAGRADGEANGSAGPLSFLVPYIRTYAGPFLTAVFFLAIEAACDLFQPTIMSRVIDQGVVTKDLRVVLGLGGLMLFVTAIGALAASARNIISGKVSQNFGSSLRADLYRKIQSFSFTSLDRFDTASLVTRLTNDVTQVQNFANGLMRVFVKAPLLALGGIVMAVLLNPRMSLVLVAVVPIVALLIVASLRTSYPFYRRIQGSLDRVNGVMREYLSGVRVVKAFNRFDHEEARFAGANGELSSSMTKAMRVMALFSPIITLTVNLGIAAVLWFGGARVSAGGMQLGQVVAFVNYMTQILGSLMMLTFIFNMFVRARASAERIGEVFAGVPEKARAESGKNRAVRPEAVSGPAPSIASAAVSAARGWSVDFDAVTLTYDGAGEAALRGVSLSCPAGSVVGIIGSTGSGKTSLVNLVPRFYDADSGRVLVEGRDVRDHDLRALRGGIALVPQRSLLFTGTVLENLRWGKPDATLADAEEAARAACAHEFIEALPSGYDSLIGRGGLSLSGGQRQRLAIARALIRKPAVLILDDSMSAVDAVTEARVREALPACCAGATVFLIAQRISSVRHANLILVLDDGEVAGLGTHDELLDSCEVYRDIHRSQVGLRETVHG
jgi:ATP-binding cassette subfamily B protein